MTPGPRSATASNEGRRHGLSAASSSATGVARSRSRLFHWYTSGKVARSSSCAAAMRLKSRQLARLPSSR